MPTRRLPVLAAASLLLAMSAVAVDSDSEPGAVPHPRALAVPDSIAAGLKSQPETHLPALIAYLTAEASSNWLKVVILHDWVAVNIDYATTEGPGGYDAGVAGVLRSGRSACEGFASLFEAMCITAGVECRTISGYGRGRGFDVLAAEDSLPTNHCWNAVRLDGRWLLVDPTWDAGYYLGDRYVRDYSTDFLLAPPEAFIHTHFPDDSVWQLLDPPVTRDRFRSLPYLRGGFFGHQLKLLTPLERINRTGRRVSFEVAAPDGVWLKALLVGRAGTTAGGVSAQRNQDGYRVQSDLPGAGRWVVELYARRAGRFGRYRWVASVGFVL